MVWRDALIRCATMVLLAWGIQTSAQAQVFNTGPWSGLYVGVHGGYSWEKDSGTSIDGSAIGLQGGYNLQLGSALLGIEADYSWSQAKGREIIPGIDVTASIDRLWSVRGRLGWVLADSLMLYGTAGYGGFDLAVKGTIAGVTFAGSAEFNGFVAGGGAELLLTRNIMLRAEALRYMGDGRSLAAGANGDITVARAAVSYKF